MILEKEESEQKERAQTLTVELAAAAEERELLTGRLDFLESQRKNQSFLARLDPKVRTQLAKTNADKEDIIQKIAEVDQETVNLNTLLQAVQKELQEIEGNRIKDDYRLAEIELCRAHKYELELHSQMQAARDRIEMATNAIRRQIPRMREAGFKCDGFVMNPGETDNQIKWLVARIEELSG